MISIPSALAIRFAHAHAKAKECSSMKPKQTREDWNREFQEAVNAKCDAMDEIGDWLMNEEFHKWEGEP